VRRGQQPPWIVPDGLWQRIEPLLPKIERNPRRPSRNRLDDRRVLCGILFVLHASIQWEYFRRARVWVGDDLLAAVGRMESRQGLAAAARTAAGRATWRRQAGLISIGDRLLARAGRQTRRDDIHEAFLDLATCVITYRNVTTLLGTLRRRRSRRCPASVTTTLA
jgi:transposase